jgi:hypothetical protein
MIINRSDRWRDEQAVNDVAEKVAFIAEARQSQQPQTANIVKWPLTTFVDRSLEPDLMCIYVPALLIKSD